MNHLNQTNTDVLCILQNGGLFIKFTQWSMYFFVGISIELIKKIWNISHLDVIILLCLALWKYLIVLNLDEIYWISMKNNYPLLMLKNIVNNTTLFYTSVDITDSDQTENKKLWMNMIFSKMSCCTLFRNPCLWKVLRTNIFWSQINDNYYPKIRFVTKHFCFPF